MGYPAKVPNYEVYKRDVASIFPDGDLRSGYDRMINHISLLKADDGSPLTYDYLLSKFKACHAQWKFRYASKEAKGYLSKEAAAERYTFDEFIDKEIYNREFVVNTGSDERSRYIFGNFSFKYLREQLIIFKEPFKNAGEKHKTKKGAV